MINADSQEGSSTEKLDFYDLAAKFVEETSTSDQPHRLLKSWARRFPEHAADLAALAYARIAEPNSKPNAASVVDEQEVVLAAQRVLSRFRPTAAPLTSLIAAAKQAGINPHKLAETLKIDTPVLAKLEQRLLSVATIPAALIDMLATEIRRGREEIVLYLGSSPRLALGANYKSDTPPSVDETDKQSFAEAIKASRMLSSDDKEYWLSRTAVGENDSDLNRPN